MAGQLLHNELIPAIPMVLRIKMAYQAAKGMHFLHSSGELQLFNTHHTQKEKREIEWYGFQGLGKDTP